MFFSLYDKRNLRSKTPQKILINLCCALFSLLVVFMVGAHQSKSGPGCIVVSCLMQYLLLATFAWMGVEGISLYKKIVRATKNRGNNDWFFRVAFGMAWGKYCYLAFHRTITIYSRISPNLDI